MTNVPTPGTLVRCRGREWVVLPSQDKDIVLLRPIGGSETETCGIYLPLEAQPEPATFPPPNPDAPGDHVSASLLRDAARLVLRSGAGPFRSLGRLSVYPRPYQLVPLLMALKQETIRLLISDDVGIGKTIEAGLIARELLDRGEIRRLAVICPPHLCEQWQKELKEKFHMDAEIVRSGTISRLERGLPRRDVSLYDYYLFLVVSVDFVKTDRNRHQFLHSCPELVIVDEAHTCARPPGANAGQQQRHDLLTHVSSKSDRHLILLTATPHSGIEESFVSLLSLLKPDFVKMNAAKPSEPERAALAQHFIQRQRGDIKKWLGSETAFPERDWEEAAYKLSPDYQALFQKVYNFAQDMVKSSETLSGFKRRVRYWAALALLRCVMSSPAAAAASLLSRAGVDLETLKLFEEDFPAPPELFDEDTEETPSDTQPSHVLEEGESTLEEAERKKFRQFAVSAQKLRGQSDEKLSKVMGVVEKLLKENFHPIVYCRYIATAEYVAEELKKKLQTKDKDLGIEAVTGDSSDEEREIKVKELANYPRRVLVATDCLSEGINLQDDFNSVIHYDLPWNPNRLEQREGRVDRFGQKSPKVKVVLLYSQNNPMDEAVMNVLIRKAVAIHKTLGIMVPIPLNSEKAMEAIAKALFAKSFKQLSMLDEEDDLKVLGEMMDRSAKREKESRSRYAQRAINPEEVEQELKETNAVLGDESTVESFVRSACERLNARLQPVKDYWKLSLAALPPAVQERLPNFPKELKLSFKIPAPEGVVPIGRNHPLVQVLADHLLEVALEGKKNSPASRTGAIRTQDVNRRTEIFLLRVRFLLSAKDLESPLLAEEILLFGSQGSTILSEETVADLSSKATPFANLTDAEKSREIETALSVYETLQSSIEKAVEERAAKLLESHRRVRAITKTKAITVKPELPPDLIGVYVFLPEAKGVKR